MVISALQRWAGLVTSRTAGFNKNEHYTEHANVQLTSRFGPRKYVTNSGPL